VELHLVELAIPLRRIFTTSSGEIHERRLVLIGATEGNLTGWGEAAPYPGVTPDTVDGVWESLTGDRALTPTAAAALEEAEADLVARRVGVPLWLSLGGKRRPLPASLAIGLADDPSERVAEVAPAAVKIKIRAGEDLGRVEPLRRSYPDLTIGVDANGCYSWDDRGTLLRLDALDVAYVEQPFAPDDLDAHAALREELVADVVLDESIDGVHAVVGAIESGAADVIAVAPGRLGLEACRTAHDLALAAGLRIKASGLMESGVGRAHVLAVASLPATTHSDLADEAWFLKQATTVPVSVIDDGWVEVSDRPGIGVDPDLGALEPFVVRRATVNRPAGPDLG
jgi:o-succinylbenzoate synthase